MKYLKTYLVLAILMAACFIALSAATPSDEELFLDEDDIETTTAEVTSDLPIDETQEPISLRGSSRFLAQTARHTMKCNKYPQVCRADGSPGPDCCKKKCVNMKTDRLNCGMCGKKCKYSEICCKGNCVNPMSNKKHCGSCDNMCKNGSACVYGMCSYA